MQGKHDKHDAIALLHMLPSVCAGNEDVMETNFKAFIWEEKDKPKIRPDWLINKITKPRFALRGDLSRAKFFGSYIYLPQLLN